MKRHFQLLTLAIVILLLPATAKAISGNYQDPGGGTYWGSVEVAYVSEGKTYSWCTGRSEAAEMDAFRGFESEYNATATLEHPTVKIKFRFHGF